MLDQISINIGPDLFCFQLYNEDGVDSIAFSIGNHGLVYYEIPVPTVLAAIVRAGSGAFVDVGANTGVYSLLAAAANPNVEVFAFEPVPSIRTRLEHNLRVNLHLAPRISVEPVALSNCDGSVAIAEHISPVGLLPTSSTLEPISPLLLGSYREVMVDVTTFDLWMQQHPRLQPTLLKVDIEGHEQAFFEGARHSLKLCRPLIIIELLQPSNFGYFANFLHDNLYQDIALCPGVARLLNEPHFIADAWNHLFCPQERVWEMACLCNLIGLPIG